MKRHRAFGAHLRDAVHAHSEHACCHEGCCDSAQGQLVIYGAGGHGLVVAQAAQAQGWTVLGFIDDHATHAPEGFTLLKSTDALKRNVKFHLAIGDNATRQKLHESMVKHGASPATIIHPAAMIAPDATLAPGVFVGPNAVVHASAKVDTGAIINSGAIVEHHCRIGAFAHIAPGAALGGLVRVGARTLVGINAAVRPRITIGDDCTIGIGAAVVTDIPSNKTAVGVPARVR